MRRKETSTLPLVGCPNQVAGVKRAQNIILVRSACIAGLTLPCCTEKSVAWPLASTYNSTTVSSLLIEGGATSTRVAAVYNPVGTSFRTLGRKPSVGTSRANRNRAETKPPAKGSARGRIKLSTANLMLTAQVC